MYRCGGWYILLCSVHLDPMRRLSGAVCILEDGALEEICNASFDYAYGMKITWQIKVINKAVLRCEVTSRDMSLINEQIYMYGVETQIIDIC